MIRKKHLTKLTPKGSITNHVGKGASEEVLPSRSALNSLTQGDPLQRTIGNYAKATPMGNPLYDDENVG